MNRRNTILGATWAVIALLLLLSPLRVEADRRWAKTYGGSTFDYSRDVALDAQGNVFVVGYTSSLNFPKTLSSGVGGQYDAYLMKLDSAGNRLWALVIGGAGNDFGYGVAVDGAGNAYVVGKSSPGFPLTSTTWQGGAEDAFIAKVNAAGAIQWAVPYGGPGNDRAEAVGVDAAGNVYACGVASVSGFPATQSSYAGAQDDAFILQLDPNGNRLRAQLYGGASFDYANDIVVLPDGTHYIVGETGSGNLPVTSSTYAGSSGTKAFVAKFDASGSRAFAYKYGGSVVERAYAVAWDAVSQQVMVAGYTESPDFPANKVTRPGVQQDVFLLRIYPDGSRNWATRFGGTGNEYARGLAIDTMGNIFFTGETGSTDYPSTLPTYGSAGTDAILTKLDSTGRMIWSARYGGTQAEIGSAIAVSSPNLYFAGHTQSASFPTTSLQYAGSGTETFVIGFTDCLGYQAQFAVDNACVVDSARFLSTSLAGTTVIATYFWTFGDGGSSALQDPVHAFGAPGSYPVKLRIVNGCGTADSVTSVTELYPMPVAAFGYADTCSLDSLHLSSLSTTSGLLGSTLVGWEWRIDSLPYDSLANTQMLNVGSGLITAQLLVTTNHGCQDSITQSIHIAPLPIAVALVDDVCYPQAMAWSDSSHVSLGSVTLWSWLNGGSVVGSSPAFTWMGADTGLHVLALAVETAAGCRDTTTASAQVWPKPRAAFAVADVCFPHSVIVQDSAFGNGSQIVAWTYALGDGNSVSVAQPVHAYAAAGAYTLTQVVATDHGCRDTIVDTVAVFPKPESAFAVDTVCLGESTQFTNESQVSTGQIVWQQWQFGDGDLDSVADAQHGYLASGIFTAALTIGTDHGCLDTLTQQVLVHALPVFGFTYLQGRADLCIGDSALLAVDRLFPTYDWVGDDTTAAIWVHDAGFYAVAVTDTNGCSSTDSSLVAYHPVAAPNPVIWPLDSMWACAHDSTILNAGPGYATYLWTTGDTTQWLVEPLAGAYAVTVTNGFGCEGRSDSVVLQYFAPQALPVISQVGDSLVASAGAAWQWYLDGQPIGPATGPSWMPFGSGSYAVLVTDSNGCSMLSEVFSMTVGVGERVVSGLRLWPNPVQAGAELHFDGWQGLATVTLVDVMGKVVFAGERVMAPGHLLVSDLAPGVYFLRVASGKGSFVARVVLR